MSEDIVERHNPNSTRPLPMPPNERLAGTGPFWSETCPIDLQEQVDSLRAQVSSLITVTEILQEQFDGAMTTAERAAKLCGEARRERYEARRALKEISEIQRKTLQEGNKESPFATLLRAREIAIRALAQQGERG